MMTRADAKPQSNQFRLSARCSGYSNSIEWRGMGREAGLQWRRGTDKRSESNFVAVQQLQAGALDTGLQRHGKAEVAAPLHRRGGTRQRLKAVRAASRLQWLQVPREDAAAAESRGSKRLECSEKTVQAAAPEALSQNRHISACQKVKQENGRAAAARQPQVAHKSQPAATAISSRCRRPS